MKVGITIPQAGQQATRENIIQGSKTSRSGGFDSVWVFERLLWPLKLQAPSIQEQRENIDKALGLVTGE